MPTDFPKAGDDKAVSLRNSDYARFDLAYAQDLKANHPDVWALGGNIRGNAQFAILSRIQKQGGSPKTRAEEKAVRLREAWAARHYGNKRPPGVVAQIKWLVVGSLGESKMKSLINDEKEKRRGQDGSGAARNAAPEPTGDGGHAAPDGVLLRTAIVRAVRRETRPTAQSPERKLVVVDFVASTEDVDSHDSILVCDWAEAGRLKRYESNPVLLWMHNRGEPRPAIGHCENVVVRNAKGNAIGSASLRLEGNVLLATAVFDDSTEFDREIAAKYEKGVLRAFSVGFCPGKCEVRVIDDREVVVFSENELREISAVNVPSNAAALATGQRDLVQTAREMARAAGGTVAMRDVLTRLSTIPQTRDVPSTDRDVTPTPALGHGDIMATPIKKIVHPDASTVRATDDGATFDVACPHCDAPVEVSARSLPLPTKRATEIEEARKALDTERAALASERTALTETRALLESEQKRAAGLESRLAETSRGLSNMLLAAADRDVTERIGKKIEPHEKDEEMSLARMFLADNAPDMDGPKDADGKPTRTLGQKKWAERLAKLDQRRDLGLLAAPITADAPIAAPDQRTQAAAAANQTDKPNTFSRGGDAFAALLDAPSAAA